MTIFDVDIDNFGKLSDYHVSFDNGINVIYGENESGKSTICEFIRAMLFGLDDEKGRSVSTNRYMRLCPWENEVHFCGGMRIGTNYGVLYIRRNFAKNARKFSCVNETTGEEITEKAFMNMEFIKKMSAKMFDNMAYTRLLKGTVKNEVATQLDEYVKNTAMTRGADIDLKVARQLLDKAKKCLCIGELDDKVYKLHEQVEKNNELSEQLQRTEEQAAQMFVELEKEKNSKNDEMIINLERYAGCYCDILSKYSRLGKMKNEYRMQTELVQEKRDEKKHIRRSAKLSTGVVFFCAWMLIAAIIMWILWGKSLCVIALIASVPVVIGVYAFTGKSIEKLILNRNISKGAYEEASYYESIKENERNINSLKEEICTYASKVVDMSKCSGMEQVMESLEVQMECINEKISRYHEARQIRLQEMSSQSGSCLGRADTLREMLGSSYDTRKAYKEAVRCKENAYKKSESIDIAKEVISQVSDGMKDTFVSLVGDTLNENVETFTAGHHKMAIVDSSLGLKVMENNRFQDVAALSTGTIEQVGLGVRFAIKQMSGYNGPIFFDDAFACYDDNRLKIVLDRLAHKEVGQIFVLTCTNRELNVMNDNDISYTLISM